MLILLAINNNGREKSQQGYSERLFVKEKKYIHVYAFAVTAEQYTLNWNCESSKSNFFTYHALQGAHACACVCVM
jgi:hypothetical protein